MLGRKEPEKLTEREQVARRREEVLSRGRKFKYPLQYAKHRVAIAAAAISLVALITFGAIYYLALYQFGNSDDIVYRGAQLLPLPVATVAGENVRFSDYLLLYRSSIAVVNQDVEDFDSLKTEYKRSSLDSAEKYTYATKLARELDLEISDEAVEEFFHTQRTAGGTDRSEASFLKILTDNFGLTKSEYLRMLRLLLTKTKVSEALDSEAHAVATQVEGLLASTHDLSAIADQLGESVVYEDTGGLLGIDNIDGGRTSVALSLEPGAVSQRFVSTNGDAYYYVRLLEKTESELSYASLKIPFTEFDKRFAKVLADGDYQEYIVIDDAADNTKTSSEED